MRATFDALENKLSKGHVHGGQEKGFQTWGNSPNICYISDIGDGERLYYQFVPGERKIQILGYSNKNNQQKVADRVVSKFEIDIKSSSTKSTKGKQPNHE